MVHCETHGSVTNEATFWVKLLTVTIKKTNGVHWIKLKNPNKFNTLKMMLESKHRHEILDIYSFTIIDVLLKKIVKVIVASSRSIGQNKRGRDGRERNSTYDPTRSVE